MKPIPIEETLTRYPAGTFVSIAPFNEHHFGACAITGVSPVWEMHPDTDEFFHILEGEIIIRLREVNGITQYHAAAGNIFVVPRGIWHKPSAPSGARFVFFTPGQSLHSEADDPLAENP